MDETATLIALTDLVSKYPDITMTTVTDVLQACDHDPTAAYTRLCEMVIPPEDVPADMDTPSTPAPAQSQSPPPPPPRTGAKSPPRATRAVRYAGASPSPPASPEPAPQGAPPPPPRGAWAAANMGRRYRRDELCARYTWLAPTVADALFEKYGDCVELVEADVLEMFPVDEPAAFAGGDGLSRDAPACGAASTAPPPCSAATAVAAPPVRGAGGGGGGGGEQESKAARVADALRERDEHELRCANRAGAVVVDRRGRTMEQLREELWTQREHLSRANALASQTRQTRHVAEARRVGEDLSRLSAYLLERIRASDEYNEGYIDLHGLTKDEAIELVRGKLDDDGERRRFRVITGKGIHSHNGQAVLRPALERYLQRRRVKYSQYGDGIMTVIP